MVVVGIIDQELDFIGTRKDINAKEASLIVVRVTFLEDDRTTAKDVSGRAFSAKVIDDDDSVVQSFTPDLTDASIGIILMSLDMNTNAVPAGRYYWEWWDTSSNIFVTGGDMNIEKKRFV